MANTHFGVTAFLRSAGKEEATNSAGERLDCRRFFAVVRPGRQNRLACMQIAKDTQNGICIQFNSRIGTMHPRPRL